MSRTSRGQAGLDLGTQELLLILLLRLVAPAVEGVHRQTRRRRAIRGASMPHVRVHDGDAARLPGEQHFVRMRRQRIVEHVLRPRPPLVRSRNHAGRAVLACEVVEHPDGVADPIPFVVGYGRHVHVKRLPDVGRRIGRSGIQAAQLDLGPEDVPNAFEQPRQHDRAGEDPALVDEVRQPVGVLFLFGIPRRRGRLPPRRAPGCASATRSGDQRPIRSRAPVSVLVELPLFLLGHGPHVAAVTRANECAAEIVRRTLRRCHSFDH